MKAQQEFSAGDWVAVPLRTGGYGVGLLAIADRGGEVIGYFFGPPRKQVPQVEDLIGLSPSDAVLVRRIGVTALKRGDWPVIGRASNWNPEDWPMPVFMRYEELTGRTYRVFYEAKGKLPREELVSPGLDEQGPSDVLSGSGALEAHLTDVLAGSVR